MADSLRDQLVKIGMATQEQADRALKKQRSKPNGKSGKRSGPKPGQGKHPASKQNPKQTAKKAPSASQKKPLPTLAEVNAQEAAQKKEIKAKIKALIEGNRIEDHSGELVYSYIVGTRVKQIHLAEAYKNQIVEGTLAITRLNRHTMLIPTSIVPEIKALNPDWLIVQVEETGKDAVQSGQEDPYAEYDVPDDLVW